MNKQLAIRQMSSDDTQRLGEIYVDVYDAFDVGEKWDVDSAKKLIEYWLHRQPDLAFVAEFEGQMIGAFVAGIKPWWDGNHLVDGEFFVHPDYQKSGAGTQLSIAIYEAALEKYQVTYFDTTTFKNTEFPISWYKLQGFEVNKDWVLISVDVKQALAVLKAK